MTKEKDNNKGKKRADKYEEKVKFDGTFEDMVNMSFKKPKSYKYAVGDIVDYNGKDYIVVDVNVDGEVFDYLISEHGNESSTPFGVKEEDLKAA